MNFAAKTKKIDFVEMQSLAFGGRAASWVEIYLLVRHLLD